MMAPLSPEFGSLALESIARVLLVIGGAAIIVAAFVWAARVMMIRGGVITPLARLVLDGVRVVFFGASRLLPKHAQRQHLLALYMPFALLAILAAAMVIAAIGWVLIIYGATDLGVRSSFLASVSSISTLGFANQPETSGQAILFAVEGLTTTFFVGLLIVYINSMYDTFTDQRSKVRRLDALVGRVENGTDLLANAAAGAGIDALDSVWQAWTADFARLDDTYRSTEGYLAIFAPFAERHWLIDAPIILDAAVLRNSLVDRPNDVFAAQCLRHGSAALGKAAAFHRRPIVAGTGAELADPMTREEFDDLARRLRNFQVPVAIDLDAAWGEYLTGRAAFAPAIGVLGRLLGSPSSQSQQEASLDPGT